MAILLLGLGGVASGQCEDIDGIDGQYCEDFEGDDFVVGEDVTDDDDWELWDVPLGFEAIIAVDPAADPDDPDDPLNDNQVVEISTDNDIVTVFDDDEYTSGTWDIVVQTYTPSEDTGGLGYFIVMNTYTVAPKNWSSIIIFNTAEGVVTSLGGTGFTVPGSVDLVTDEWVQLRINVDLDANEQTIYYGDEEVASGDWYTGGVAEIQCIDLYGGAGATAEIEVYFDDLAIYHDCNDNDIPDNIDIEDETSGDCNGDGIPDECQDTAVREIATLVDAESSTDDHFGNAVAMDGDVLVVGARDEDEDDASNAGAVHVYRRSEEDAEDWVFEQRLVASDFSGSDRFGYSVDVSGDVIVVGARRDDDDGSSSGSAYIFEYDADTGEWDEVAKVTAGDEADASDEFGWDVAADGDHVAVSAWLDDTVPTNSGTVYTFERCGGEWIAGDVLRPEDLGSGDRFGKAVALSGNWLIAGAYTDDELGSNAGAAYLFEFDGSNWSEIDKLVASDGLAGERFGQSVAMADNVAVVGAHLGDHFDADGAPLLVEAGKAYVYRRDMDTGSWVEEQILVADDAGGGDEFGFAVDTSGDVIVVGAPDTDGSTGSAYVYTCEDEAWTQQGEVLGSTIEEEEDYATAVATSGTTIAVSAWADDESSAGAGSVPVFIMPDCDFDDIPDACQIDEDPDLDLDGNGVLDECEDGVQRCANDLEDDLGCGEEAGPMFIRGDANNDGVVSGLPDGLFLLFFGFVPGSPEPPCMDAADANGDNTVGGLPDGLYMLFYAFVPGSEVPPLPFPDCGVDPDEADEEDGPDCAEENDICAP